MKMIIKFVFIMFVVLLMAGGTSATTEYISNFSSTYSFMPDYVAGNDPYGIVCLDSDTYCATPGRDNVYIQLPTTSNTVNLFIYTSPVYYGNGVIKIYNTSVFDEQTITYNNAPADGDLITTFILSSGAGALNKIVLTNPGEYIVIKTDVVNNQFIVYSDDQTGLEPYIEIPSFDPSGYVNDTNGAVLENAKVILSNATYSNTVYTDSTGLYNATIYANGTYNYNVTKTGFTTLSGSQEFTIGGTAYNFTLSPSAGQLYGTVYEWTNGTIPSHVSFDIKEYNKVSLNPNQSDGSRLVYAGSTLTWFGGYVWKVQDIDSVNSQAYIKLLYNGSEISAGIVNKGEQASVVVYEDFDEVIYLTLDVINVFSGREANTAWVKPGQKLKVKTTWEKILRSITYRYANAITEYIYGSTQTNLELWLEMKADKQEDLEAHPPTADNPCGGTYQTHGGGIDEYYSAVLPFNPDATYNLVDASFKMASPSGQGKIGYAFTDDDIVYPDGTMFPESGYQWITGISSCNIYPTTSDNFNNLDANNNKKIKIWFKMSSGNVFLLYNAYASASCVDCNKKPLSGASVYYNYLAKTYQTGTDLFGNYNISIPFTTQLVRYTKAGYENKNNTFIFNSTNTVQEFDVIINKSISNDTKVDEAIWVLPNVITKGQPWAIYYRTLNKYSEYQIITQRFGTDDNLETFDINSNTESFINMGTYQPGYYVAMLRGACWYCSWGVIASTNFTVRSSIPSVFWHSSEYYLGSVMKLGIDIPVGGVNANVTAYYPNGSVLYSHEHSAAEGIQTILFNTSFGGDYPPGKYIAEIEGNTNQSTTTLYNINLTNYSIEAPSSVVWGKTAIIKFLSPLQSELHIYKSDGSEAIKSFVVQSSGSYSFNTSRLENKADTLTVKLIQNNVEKAKTTITIGQGAVTTDMQTSALVDLLSSNLFWALIFTVGMMTMIAFATMKREKEQ